MDLIKRTQILALIFAVLFSFGRASGQILSEISFLSPEEKMAALNHEIYLTKMGFENFTGQIQETLDSTEPISEVSKLALVKSKKLLIPFDSVRNLACVFYALLVKNNLDSKWFSNNRDLMTGLLIQQLNFFPLISMEPLPPDQIKAVTNELSIPAALEVKKKILIKRAQNRFASEKINILKVFIQLMNLQPEQKLQAISWLDQTIASAISESYTQAKRQQNRLLGRALVITFIKFLRQHGQSQEELSLKNKLRKHELFLENYVSAYYVASTSNFDHRGVALKSGDIALEYSHGQEAFFTSLVVQPQTKRDAKISELYKLKNSIFDFYKFLDDTKYYNTLDKKDTYQNLTESEKKIYSNFWDKKYANGFSHAGMVDVRTDSVDGIKVAWIWDIYPEKDKVGVVRIISTESFSYPEKMLKIGFLRYDSRKLLKSFQAQVKKRGYLENIWVGYSSFVGEYADGSEGPSKDSDEEYVWKTKVAPDLVQSWTLLNSEQADLWFDDVVWPAIHDRLRKYLVSHEAKVFADGLVSAKDMLYCSQMILLAYLEGINLDLQNSPDRIWESIKYLSESVEKTLKINIKYRIVSPNGLVWQEDLFKNLVTFYHDRSRVFKQQAQTQPTLVEEYLQLGENQKKEVEPILIDENNLIKLKDNEVALDLES